MRSFLRLMAVVVGLSLVAPVVPGALAETKKSAKKKKGEGSKEEAQAAKTDGKKKVEERKGPAKMQEVPKLEDAEKEALADKKRDEAIEQLKKIIPKIEDGSPQKADLYYQLSELYWEKSKYLFRKEMKQHEDAYREYEAAINRGEKAKEPKERHSESDHYRQETMSLYERILREYPSYERKDEVLFSLAYNMYEIGKKDQAISRYLELIKNYPGSKFVADTYVQLGNHFFDVANDLPRARENYQKALNSKVPKIYSYALYKLGWCDYNAGKFEDSLKKFQDVVEFAETRGKDMVDLKNEALNDMIVVFVQLNRADDAMAYFKRKAPKKRQPKLFSKLAYQLSDAGHHENAIRTFRFMINEDPGGETAPEFQQAIVRSYEGLRQRDQVKAEIKRLVDLYRPGSTWWKSNESRKEVIRNAFNVTEEAMRTMVTEYHNEAQKTKQVETYRLARDIYKQYVDAFASNEDENFVSDMAFNMRFYYSEILWALEEWENAASQYKAVVAFKIPARDTAREVSTEKYRQQAAYNAILAYDKLVKIERGLLAKSDLKEGQKVDEQKKKGTVEKTGKIQKRKAEELVEQKLTRQEENLVAACDTYNQLYPSNQDEIDVRYTAAVIYYDRNHFVEAAKRLGEIILKWPEERRSQDAADLTMYVLEAKEEWLELNKLARQFLGNKKLSKPGTEFTKRVANVVEGSQYKWVDEVLYKREKDPGRAAEEFLKFVAEFPKSDKADRALTYSMIIFRDANQLDRGVNAGERVLKEYPKTAFELKVRFTLAKFYEQMAEFLKSAEMYEAFIAAYDKQVDPKKAAEAEKAAAKGKPTSKAKVAAKSEAPSKPDTEEQKEERKKLLEEAKGWVADAQFNAALWWEGLGQYEKAIAAYNQYMTRFKDKKDVPEIAFNVGLIYEKMKKLPEAVKAFESFNTAYAKDTRANAIQHYRAKYRQFLAHKALKNAKETDKLQDELIKSWGKLGKDEKNDPRVVNAYAQARFLALEPMWKGYVDVKFDKVATLKNDLATKLKKIQEVEKAYTDVLAIGAGEWGIAALTRIGLAYGDFAQNFLDSPNPKKLDEEQLEMYRGELENRAFPLEEKAIEALEKALAKSYELSVYNEWTLLAQDRINKYRPGFYGKVKDVSYEGSEFFATSPILKEAPVAQAKTELRAKEALPGGTNTAAVEAGR